MATISVHHVQAALQGLKRHGIEPLSLLERAGINPALLQVPIARVDARQMTQLVRLVWREFGDEFMGFTAQSCPSGVFALMVRLVQYSPGLGQLLRRGTAYYNFVTDDIRTTMVAGEEKTVLTIEFLYPELDPDQFYLEFWMVIWHRLASWFIGRSIPLIYASFERPKPPHAAELHYLFPCEHRFESEANQLAIPSSYLKSPLIRSEEEVEDFLKSSPADFMTIPGDDDSVTAQVRRLLAGNGEYPLRMPRRGAVARKLHVTPQTLHRHLKREGTSYQQVKAALRRDLAVRFLVSERKSVIEIAELLGFAEPRSLSRAFKSWTGLSPREYDRLHMRIGSRQGRAEPEQDAVLAQDPERGGCQTEITSP